MDQKNEQAIPLLPGEAIAYDLAKLSRLVGEKFGRIVQSDANARREIGMFFEDRLRKIHKLGRLTIEEGPDQGRGDGVWICIQPLDGRRNFLDRHHLIGLPFTSVFTVLDRTDRATFKDVLSAGVIDLRTGNTWTAWRDEKGAYRTVINHETAPTPAQERKIDLGTKDFFPDLFFPPTRELAAEMFRGEEGWLRSPGCASYEMACVASGIAAATLCLSQRQRELGAGYAIVKGAGGTVCDFDGRPLDDVPFDFHSKTPAICAGNTALADDLVARAKKARTALARRDTAEKFLRHSEACQAANGS